MGNTRKRKPSGKNTKKTASATNTLSAPTDSAGFAALAEAARKSKTGTVQLRGEFVGALTLPGYPLKPGEKLAVLKISSAEDVK